MELTKAEDIKIFIDPFKLKILNYMRAVATSLTVKQIADGLGEVPSKIHYHIKKLEGIGIVEIERTEEIRGIVAKYYKIIPEEITISHEDYKDEETRNMKSILARNLSEIFDDAKNKFINAIKSEDDDFKENMDGVIKNKTIYTDEEGLRKINNEINEILNKYSKKTSNKMEYEVFISMAKTLNK